MYATFPGLRPLGLPGFFTRWIGGVFIALSLMLAGLTAHAAPPPAGQKIINAASASYSDASGTTYTVISNSVETTVQQVASLTLVANGAQNANPGGVVNYPHTLTNTGNGSDAFSLTTSNTGGFSMANVQIFADNGSGAPTGSPITSTGVLAAGASFKFIVQATLPGTATAAQTNTITATGATGGGRELITAQSGVAYRPVETDVWNALGRIEYKKDADSTLGPGLNRDESGLIFSAHLNVQPVRHWTASARYAAKWGSDKSNGISSRSFTQLIGGRSTWDLTQRWDVSLQAYRLWGNGAAETAAGVEVGYLAWKNMWASVGYNFKGFKAADMAGEAYTQRGLYLRVRFKFDENLLNPTALDSSSATGTAAPKS